MSSSRNNSILKQINVTKWIWPLAVLENNIQKNAVIEKCKSHDCHYSLLLLRGEIGHSSAESYISIVVTLELNPSRSVWR